MNENSSKQVLLSILGIAVLVVAVVGVSFAFFSYSKQGVTNNVITTGSIFMHFEEGNGINLTNQFPMTDAAATQALLKGNNDEVDTFEFTVTGWDSSNKGIDYTVYLTYDELDAMAGKTRLANSEVSLLMETPVSSNGQTINPAITRTPITVAQLITNQGGDLTAGVPIATGTIKAGTTEATKQTDTFKLQMFVNSTVTISDTDKTVRTLDGQTLPTKYCAHEYKAAVGDNQEYGCLLHNEGGTIKTTGELTDTSTTKLPVYSDTYYSLKVKVVGQTVGVND